MKKTVLIWAFLVFAALAVHFGNTGFFNRGLIDHDDLKVIKPLMSMDLWTYFTERLPERRFYAFPITDLTLFFDKTISALVYAETIWLTQFVLFALSVPAWILTAQLFTQSWPRVLTVVGIAVAHPFNVEVLQWATSRKYTTQGVFLFWGTFLALKIFRENRSPKTQEWVVLMALWIGAILCFPNTMLWMPWIVALFGVAGRIPKQKFATLFVAALGFAALYFYLTVRGSSDWNASTLHMFSSLPNMERAAYYGVRAIGRGTFNTLLPFWPSAYYNEQSPLTWVGWALFLALVGLFIYAWRNSTPESSYRANFVALVTLCLCLLLPVANTILPFLVFMLADRHFYLVIPYAVILLMLTFDTMPTARRVVPWIVAVWLAFAAYTSFSYAPLWKNDLELMKTCARNEKATHCISQAIRRRFFSGQCSQVSDMLLLGAKVFTSRSPYTAEFSYETPTFHAACIGLQVSLSAKEKLEKIESLETVYPGIAEIAMGRVFTLLIEKRYDEAWAVAKKYYLDDIDHGPPIAVYSVVSIYAGQVKALCKIIKTAECEQVRDAYLNFHKSRITHTGAADWGYRITLLAAKGREN